MFKFYFFNDTYVGLKFSRNQYIAYRTDIYDAEAFKLWKMK